MSVMRNAAAPAGRPPAERWQLELRRELNRRDPRLAVVYEIYSGHFEGDCSAARLARYIKAAGCDWAPHRSTLARWLNVIQRTETEYRLRAFNL
jgi:hypothetical protein